MAPRHLRDGELGGRVAIVTGAGSGIGEAVALELAARGAGVLVCHAPGDPRRAGEVVEAIRGGGGCAYAHAADVADPIEVDGLVSACTEWLGPPDVAVANAGIALRTPAGSGAGEAFARVLAVDLIGVQLLFAAVAPTMRERGWGRLLATSSISGHLYGWGGHAAYCAAKAGVAGLVRAHAVDHGGSGITANAVAPGVVRTPQSLDPEESLGEAGLRRVACLVPCGRVGDPADIAGVFAFLASDAAAYVNGQMIVVDGGLSVVEPS